MFKAWKLLLLVCLCAVVLLAAGLILHGVSVRRQAEPEAFSRAWQGIQWEQGASEAAGTVTVSVDGEKNAAGDFRGAITVTREGETLLQVEDCLLYPYPGDSEGVWFLCDRDPVILENLDTDLWPVPQSDGTVDTRSLLEYVTDHAYALLFADAAWSGLLLMEWTETSGGGHATGTRLLAAPARDLSEAGALARHLAEKTIWDGNTWTAPQP